MANADAFMQFILKFVDETGPGAAAASQNMDRLGHSVDKVDDATTKTGKSNGNLIASFAKVGASIMATIGIANLLTAAWQSGYDVIDKYFKLADTAGDLGMGVESLQALRLEGRRAGMSIEELDGAIKTMETNVAKGAVGLGRMGKALGSVDEELLQQIITAKSVNEQLDLMATAFAKVEDQQMKEIMAISVFGGAGFDMIDVLSKMEKGTVSLTDKYRNMGLIMEGTTVQAMVALRGEMEEIAQRSEIYADRAAMAWAPFIEQWERFQGNVGAGINLVIENSKPIDQRNTQALAEQEKINTREIYEMWTQLQNPELAGGWREILKEAYDDTVYYNSLIREEMGKRADRQSAEEAALEATRTGAAELAMLMSEADAVQLALGQTGEAIAALEKKRDQFVEKKLLTPQEAAAWFDQEKIKLEQSTDAYKLNEAAKKAAAEAARELAEREKEVAAMSKEYAMLVGSAGNKTFELAELTKKLNEWMAAGVMPADRYFQTFQIGSDKITGVTETTAKYLAMLEDTNPIDKATNALNDLYADWDAGRLTDFMVFIEMWALLQGNIDKATQSVIDFQRSQQDDLADRMRNAGQRQVQDFVPEWDQSGRMGQDQAAERDSLAQFQADQLAELDRWREDQLALEREKGQIGIDIEAAYQAQKTALVRAGEADRTALVLAQEELRRNQAMGALSGMTADIRSAVGERSAIYKAAFLAEKTFAIASAMVQLPAAYAKALGTAPDFWTGLANYAQLISLGAQIIGSIGSVRLALKDGGMVTGPGGPRDDKVPAWLSNGEFVVNAQATAQNRGLLEMINRGGRMRDGGAVGGGGGGGNGPINLSFTIVEANNPERTAELIEAKVMHVLQDQRRSGGMFEGVA